MRLPLQQELRYSRAKGDIISGQSNMLSENDGVSETVVSRSGLTTAVATQYVLGKGLFSLDGSLFAQFDDKLIQFGYSPTDQRLGVVDVAVAPYETVIAGTTRIIARYTQPISSPTTKVAMTTNGVDWSITTLSGTNRWRGGAWDGSKFWLVGAGPTNNPTSSYLTSTNGTAWTTNSFGFTINANSVAINGSLVLVVGFSESAFSDNGGTTWTELSTGGFNGDFTIETVWTDVSAYGGGFIVSGYRSYDNTGAVEYITAFTTNGQISEISSLLTTVGTVSGLAVSRFTPKVAVVGNTAIMKISVDASHINDGESATLFQSTNGRTWKKQISPAVKSWRDITSNGEMFLLVGNDVDPNGAGTAVYSTSDSIYVSIDGTEWHEWKVPLASVWHGCAIGLSGVLVTGSYTNPGWSPVEPTGSIYIPTTQPLPIVIEFNVDADTVEMFDFAQGL